MSEHNAQDSFEHQDYTNFEAVKHQYQATYYFEKNCGSQILRAYMVIHKISKIAEIISFFPENFIGEERNILEKTIRTSGFRIKFASEFKIDILKEELQDMKCLYSLELEMQ